MAPLPTRIFAGIEVTDTPLITKALSLARESLNDFAYNHSVRSWLFGAIIINSAPEFSGCDREAHAVSAILHDLGWSESSDLVSPDKRFEVDGANAARVFLKKEASDWDHHRLQLVWDAIALHTTSSIAWHKEPEVQVTNHGIMADFASPDGAFGGHVTWNQWDGIIKELPRLGMRKGVKDICCHLCRTKPETTYDNFVSQWGERYVEGYSLVGKKVIEQLENTID